MGLSKPRVRGVYTHRTDDDSTRYSKVVGMSMDNTKTVLNFVCKTLLDENVCFQNAYAYMYSYIFGVDPLNSTHSCFQRYG